MPPAWQTLTHVQIETQRCGREWCAWDLRWMARDGGGACVIACSRCYLWSYPIQYLISWLSVPGLGRELPREHVSVTGSACVFSG